jgi:hypothetical protein
MFLMLTDKWIRSGQAARGTLYAAPCGCDLRYCLNPDWPAKVEGMAVGRV